MAHIKRQAIPKSWPVTRKGTVYVVRANADLEKGVPILVAIRDMLKIAGNRKEVKVALNERNVLLNCKPVLQEKNSVSLFDVIKLVPSNKSYRLELNEFGKFELKEISNKDEEEKISKVANKKILKGGKTQINLLDGTNFLSEIKCSVNDSVLVNLKDRKIEKCIPLKENSNIMIFAGKHIGERGKVEKMIPDKKMVEVTMDGKKINVLIKQVMAVN
jgi:small subunit ribosomal protein S4e